MSTKHLLTAIKVLVFALVVGTPIFYYPWGVYPYTLAKQEFFQGLVEVAGFLWLILIYYAPKYRPRPPKFFQKKPERASGTPPHQTKNFIWCGGTPLVTLGAVFLGLLLMVSFTGVDPWRSLWSTYERGIGTVAFFHFALLGLIISSLYEEIPWRKLFFASLCVSLATVIIALIQLHVPDLLLGENPGDRPGATFGNPTFLAGYLLFNVFLGVYLILDLLRDSDRKLTGTDWGLVVFAFLATGFDTLGIFLGQTRGDILALAVGFMVLLGLYSIRPPRVRIAFLRSRWTYICSLLAILFVIGSFALTFRATFWSHVPGASRFQYLLTSFSFTNGTIAARVYALDAGWKGFLDRPWLGWGPENFTTVSSKYYDPRQLESGYVETRFDQPHNFLLGYLLSGGILLFLAFLALFAAAIFEAVRGPDALWRGVFVAALSAYVVGESFAFETIGPLLMLYLFFGFTDGAFRYGHDHAEVAKSIPPIHRKEGIHVPQGVFWSVIALGCIFAYIVNVSSVIASYYQYEGFTDFIHQNIPAGLNDFNAALSPWSPYSWNFSRDSTAAILGQYFNYPGTVTDEAALAALARAERVLGDHPMDSYDHYSLINFYNEVSRIDPQKYLPMAEHEAQEVLKLSPNRQEIYFLLAKTKTLEKDYPGALATLKTALDLDPKVADAHFYYGLLAFVTGDSVTGYTELKTAITMGRQWKTFNEPRVVADDFANAGHLDEAIPLYRVALSMNPDDLESKIELGIAYYYKGDKAQAKTILTQVVTTADLTKFSSYASVKPILDALGILPQHP